VHQLPVRHQPGRRRAASLALATLTAAAATIGVLLAEADLEYTFRLDEDRRVRYSLEIAVDQPGTLVVDAEWSGTRVLSFRLDPPATAGCPARRRSGPSPQRLQATVPDRPGAFEEPWTLSILGLADRDGGRGRLRIALPRVAVPIEEPESPPPEDEAASLPILADARALPPSWSRFATETAELRRLEAAAQQVDLCGWHDDLLDYFENRLERLVREGELPSEPTRVALASLVDAVDTVEDLRTSQDPLLVGPPPADSAERKRWIRTRHRAVRAIESRLDETLELFRRGHAPALDREEWPVRLISCLMACERHFEERALVGARRAPNREVADTQWSPILAVQRLLRAYVALEGSSEAASGQQTPHGIAGRPAG
jgi:hypothetical protein